MNELKLAQFKNISNSSDKLGYQFLRRGNTDLNHSIPIKTIEYPKHPNYSPGYSYLHFAAKNLNLACIQELIEQQVDLIQQGHHDGYTPLHVVIDSTNYKKSELSPAESIYTYIGKLNNNECVEALLSAQVEAGITDNPKSADGTSHLHIACMYNHTQAVQLILSTGESVDHATNDKHELPGYTALHFAIRYSSFEAAKVLLNYGADIYLRNFEGKSSLEWIIVRLMDTADFLAIGKRTYCPFYEQERDTLNSILKMILKAKKTEDISDDSGLTWLHVRCVSKDATTVKKFFKQNMDVNCVVKSDNKLWPGWTPLHFAACFNIEVFKFLLHNGADLCIENARGETPLDFCMQRYTPNVVHSILSTRSEFKDILFSDGTTKLIDVLLIMTDDEKYVEWFENLINIDISIPFKSPIWPGYNLLHLAVLNERITPKDMKLIFEAGQTIFTLVSVVDTEIMEYWRQIMNCLLSKPYYFSRRNADGFLPLNFAFHRRKINSVNMILNSREENMYSNGLSYLHIACATGNVELIERFQNVDNVNLDEPTACDFEWYAKGDDVKLRHVPKGSTPLRIAVILQIREVVEHLLANNVQIDSKPNEVDLLNLALINESSGSFDITNIFLGRMIELRQFVARDNLHCIHVAVLCDDEEAIEMLLQNGVDIESLFEPLNPELNLKFSENIGKTPLYIAVFHKKTLAKQALIQGGADIFGSLCDSTEDLLDLAIRLSFHTDEDFISELKLRNGNNVGPMGETNVTMLHIACEIHDVEWAKSLLENGADPNCRVITRDDSDYAHWSGGTPFTVFAEGMLYENEQNIVIELLELLLEHGADVTITNNYNKTPLHVLFDMVNDKYSFLRGNEGNENILSIIGLLLKAQQSYDVNPTDCCGLSHFHLACFVNDLEFVTAMLDAGVDVNHIYDPFAEIDLHAGYTPLHFALERKNLDIAHLLIKRGANVKIEDIRGEAPLHIALKHGCLDIPLLKLIIKSGADVNARSTKGTAPIDYLFMIKSFTFQQLNMLLNYGVRIDFTNMKPPGAGMIGLTIINTEPNYSRLSVLKRLFNAYDQENVGNADFNIIDSVINVEKTDEVTVDCYLYVLDKLVAAGCDVNQRDRQGRTALHRAVGLYNYEAVKALLLIGADLDVVDVNGEPPITREVIKDIRHEVKDARIVTLQFLDTQLWKMKHIKLDMSDATKTALVEITKILEVYESETQRNEIRAACLSELDKVRKTFINDQLSLDDFLSDSKAVIRYSMMTSSDRQAVDNFFERSDNIRKKFPEWAGFLTMQYRKAVARSKMLEPAQHVITSSGVILPALCIKEIVQYFNFNDIKLLCEYL